MSENDEFDFRIAWRKADPRIENDAREFWRGMRLIAPPEIERRIPELIAAAYVDGRLVAVSTAELSMLPQLRARFAMYRCLVSPEYRRHHLSYRISGFSREVLENWSKENPHEKIVGMAAIIQAREYKIKQREPMWPEYGLNLNLVGYNNVGSQVRVAWFKHALVEEAQEFMRIAHTFEDDVQQRR
ncbi:MAG TPA: hypothetical protein VG891_14145 [Rhizomicrobium sp.]|nr:hypothetical protein [Rhizomicrobium sp.]